MRHRLLSVLLLTNCAYYEDRIGEVGTVITPSNDRIVHADTRFSADERRDVEQASLEWARFTGGRARIVLRWDLGETNFQDLPLPILYRSERTPETGNAGGKTADGVVRLVPDTCRLHASLKACAMHEFGHLLGLDHFENINGQVMSTCGSPPVRGCGPSGVFGVLDRRECARVGICRSAPPDYTTVTVTVDPNMPNPSLEYPP